MPLGSWGLAGYSLTTGKKFLDWISQGFIEANYQLSQGKVAFVGCLYCVMCEFRNLGSVAILLVDLCSIELHTPIE